MGSIDGLEFSICEWVKNPKLRLRRSTPYYGVRQRSCRFGFSPKLAHQKQLRWKRSAMRAPWYPPLRPPHPALSPTPRVEESHASGNAVCAPMCGGEGNGNRCAMLILLGVFYCRRAGKVRSRVCRSAV